MKTPILVLLLCVLAASAATVEQKCEMAHQNIQREATKFINAVEMFELNEIFTPLLAIETILPLFEEACTIEVATTTYVEVPMGCLESIQEVYQLAMTIVEGDYLASKALSGSLQSIVPSTISQCDSSKLGNLSTVQVLLESPEVGMEKNTMKCIFCGIIVTLASNDAAYKKVNLSEYIADHLCKMFPSGLASTCNTFVKQIGPYIIEGLTKKDNSDVICRKANMCTGSDAQCNLHSYSPTPRPESESSQTQSLKASSSGISSKLSPWQWIMNLINKFADEHLPIVDFDQDGFSTVSHFRGYSWRGKDCDDFSKEIYPGRKAVTKNMQTVDYDCNGISGVNTVSGLTYKQQLCEGSDRLGVIVIGDSAGAHFSVPPKYFNVTMWEKGTFSDLIPNLSNELDFPELSATTGHVENNPFVHSIYQRIVERNRCNRNDYQNIGVNGARSGHLKDFQAIRRNHTLDHPQLVIFELIGNDVCSGHISFESMTTPEEFKANILRAWQFLDTVLPKGSHMVVWGVAKGELLYELLHNREHPLFIKYSEFYDYLNCLETSPCWGWMNSYDDVRDKTQAIADSLNQVYLEIIESTTFENFDIVYYEFPIEDAIEQAEKDGYQGYQLIEPVDGFHPNQLANYYISEIIWNRLLVEKPEWIPAINPHNEMIDTLFAGPTIVLEQA